LVVPVISQRLVDQNGATYIGVSQPPILATHI